MRTCLVCGISFELVDRGRRRMYCSKVCAAESVTRRVKAARRARLVERACAECGEVFLPSDAHTRYCSISCRKATGDRLGRERGKSWAVDTYVNTGGNTPYRQAKSRLEGALRRGARVPGELIVPVDVFERDGWICGLCDTSVDQSLKWPDPMSVSLDHVIPVSLGGTHSMANLQCAHLFCNVSKGNRVA